MKVRHGAFSRIAVPRLPGPGPVVVPALILALAVPASLRAQGDSISFRNVSVDDGLSQSWVYSILQDREGFLWFGTDEGLDRWDGYEFVHYGPSAAEGAISGGEVYTLLESRDGTIWAGTVEHGLNALDPVRGTFRSWLPDGPSNVSVADPFVTCLLEGADGSIWVGTWAGLQRLDPDSERFRTWRHDPAAPSSSLPDDRVRALVRGQDGRLWVGTENGLAMVLLAADGEPTIAPVEFLDEPAAAGAALGEAPGEERRAIKALELDPSGDLWIGTRDGLFRFSPSAGRVLESHRARQGGLASSNVWALQLDARERLWVGTHEGGLARLDPRSGQWRVFRHDPLVATALADDDVKVLRFDRSGTLWIGTFGGGVSAWTEEREAVVTYRHDPRDPQSLVDDDVWGVLPLGEELWVASEEGLTRLDPRTRSADRFPVGKGGPAAAPSTLAAARDGAIWIATEDGLERFDRETGEFRRFFEGQFVGSVVATDGGGILATANGVYRGGLDGFRRFDLPPDLESADDGPLARGSDDGRVLAGRGAALARLDLEAETAEVLWQAALADRQSGHGLVTALWLESDGTIWVGTLEAGLVEISPEGAARPWTVADGLLDESVMGLVGDRDGRLWIATIGGLERLDPLTGEVRFFDRSDGLQSREFHQGATARDADGRLYFGGIAGLTAFRPDRLAEPSGEVRTVVTGIHTLDASLTDERMPWRTSRVVLDHREPAVTFSFSVLDFVRPQRGTYRYRLSGLDSAWIDNGSRHRVTFSGLAPGSYRFQVLGANGTGVWSDVPAQVELRVLAPLWRRWWSLSALGFAALGLVGLRARARHRKSAERARADLALRESEERLQLALWGSGHAMWEWDEVTGRFRHGLEELLRLEAGKLGDRRDVVFRHAHPADRDEVEEAWRAHVRGETPFLEVEYRLRGASGGWVWIHERGRAISRRADGSAERINGTHSDTTARRRADEDLRLYAEAFEHSSEGMAIVDADLRVRTVNQAFTTITGHEPADVVGLPLGLVDSTRHEVGFLEDLWRRATDVGAWRGELFHRRRNGEVFPADVSIGVLRDRRGRTTHFIVVFDDITDRHRAEEELRKLASLDSLTGLPNRTLFVDRLEHELAKGQRSLAQAAVLILDLDRFKQVNDSLGHSVGDTLLREVADRLRQHVRATDTLARLGGDEFAVLLTDVRGPQAASKVAESLQGALAAPFRPGGNEIRCGASIGIAVYPTDGRDATTLVRNADAAMNHAKSEGRETTRFFAKELNRRVVRRLELETALARALDEDEMELHYQPRFDVETGLAIGVEALVRWRRPGRGLVGPGEFIPVAEDTGLILRLGDHVLRVACRQAARWRDAGRDLVVAVNLSARQLKSAEVADRVRECLEETGLEPGDIELEITETAVMNDIQHALEALERLSDLGVRLTVDDFGTGYSSLAYLKTLPVTALKIDRSFVRDLPSDPQDAAIIEAVVGLADRMGLDLVAEGVETKEQFDYLRTIGCREMQGFLLGRPVGPAELEALLDRGPHPWRNGC